MSAASQRAPGLRDQSHLRQLCQHGPLVGQGRLEADAGRAGILFLCRRQSPADCRRLACVPYPAACRLQILSLFVPKLSQKATKFRTPEEFCVSTEQTLGQRAARQHGMRSNAISLQGLQNMAAQELKPLEKKK